ncbi:MAG: succinate dehydrogenase / fumarate reductase, rane anchor subunit [Pseudomonadota bacterium]|nr:succinate dehydrogenase / fumarate reductase, rane anchor subunit [Pseudomonadota bacterium]
MKNLLDKRHLAHFHWLQQRLSALFLLPLSYWLFMFTERCLHASYSDMLTWLHLPINKYGLIAWFLLVCYHGALGMQVVFEDYVSRPRQRIASWSANLLFTGIALCAVFFLIQS